MFCAQCGSQIEVRSSFCSACGAKARVPANAGASPGIDPRMESRILKSEVHSTGLLKNRIAFVFTYLLCAVPTYILPYFGSNSAFLNVVGAASGLGTLPQFWFHLIALYLLIVIAWLRGGQTDRVWLAIFPFLAGIFDMMPGFNLIPFAPTFFHVVTLVVGVMGNVVASDNPGAEKRRFLVSSVGLLILVVLSLVKTQSFFEQAKKGPFRQSNHQQDNQPDQIGTSEHSSEVRRWNPDDSTATYELAISLDRLGKFDEARTQWDKVLRAAQAANDKTRIAIASARFKTCNCPDQANAFMASGLVELWDRHNPVRAAEDFRNVLALLPKHYGATYQLAHSLDEMGQRSEARLLWERVLQMAESSGDQETAKTARQRLAG